MVSQFYPPIAGGQEHHVRNLAHALVDRGHRVEVVTVATDGPAGTTLDGAVPLHHIRTTAQRLPRLYDDPVRPHAMPIMDPGFRSAIRDCWMAASLKLCMLTTGASARLSARPARWGARGADPARVQPCLRHQATYARR